MNAPFLRVVAGTALAGPLTTAAEPSARPRPIANRYNGSRSRPRTPTLWLEIGGRTLGALPRLSPATGGPGLT
jgi:hypothetical protein